MIALEREAPSLERAAVTPASVERDSLLRQAGHAVLSALEEPAARAADALCQAIEDLVNNGDFYDSRLCYALGYCWYHFPLDDERKQVEIEGWLRRALALDPANHDARLYLGLLRFGEKRYAAARELFAAIPPGYFHGRREDWQEVKREELILCCDIAMTGQADLERLKQLCRHYLLIPDDEAPVPLELIRTLLAAAWNPAATLALKAALGEAGALIHGLGLDDAFREELDEVRHRLFAAYHRRTGLLPERDFSHLKRGAGCATPRVADPCSTP